MFGPAAILCFALLLGAAPATEAAARPAQGQDGAGESGKDSGGDPGKAVGKVTETIRKAARPVEKAISEGAAKIGGVLNKALKPTDKKAKDGQKP